LEPVDWEIFGEPVENSGKKISGMKILLVRFSDQMVRKKDQSFRPAEQKKNTSRNNRLIFLKKISFAINFFFFAKIFFAGLEI